MDGDSLDCSLLLVRAWADERDLAAQLRAALLARPSANVVILQNLGVLVLAPSLASLARRMGLTERLLLLATGAPRPAAEGPPSRAPSEALGASGALAECLAALQVCKPSVSLFPGFSGDLE